MTERERHLERELDRAERIIGVLMTTRGPSTPMPRTLDVSDSNDRLTSALEYIARCSSDPISRTVAKNALTSRSKVYG